MIAFIMMGQSNMSGRGALDELPPLEPSHVFAWRDGRWEPAREPVVRDRPFSGEGMGTSFGQAVAAATGEDVGLIPCSLGGSPLDAWQPGQELFETALAQSLAALAAEARIAGVLWHQGEADSEDVELAHTYFKRFAPMMAEFEARLRDGAKQQDRVQAVAQPLPVVVGELGDYLDGFASSKYHRVINAQLHEYAAGAPARACVTARDLPHKGDHLHFSARAQRMLGLRYADAWLGVALHTGLI